MVALTQSLGGAFLAFAAIGIVYTLGATALVRRFAARAQNAAAGAPGITLLKPLCGAETHLHENLVSFCDQDYAGPLQILFGVQHAGDAAIAEVNRLIAERPDRDLRLIVTANPRGPNPKIANLVGLEPHIRHDVVVVSDSDIAVGRDYLATTVAALEKPGVGLVTWLYRGAPRAGVWSRLACMAIDYQFFPSVLVGLRLGLARPSFGSTLALRRATLASLGGFRAFLTRLADDHAIGEAVRRAGMRVVIAQGTLVHTCSERSFAALLRHELRWARTIRSIDPRGYAGSAITHPLPLALIGASVGDFGVTGIGMLVGAVLSRLVLARQVDHTLGGGAHRWWLAPARDILSFGIFVASYFVGIVSWRGHRYEVRADGSLVSRENPTA